MQPVNPPPDFYVETVSQCDKIRLRLPRSTEIQRPPDHPWTEHILSPDLAYEVGLSLADVAESSRRAKRKGRTDK